MLDKKQIKEALGQKDYKKISNLFLNEYKGLLSGFLNSKGIEAKDSESINGLINKVNIYFPDYYGVTKTISDFVNNEDITIYERINDMIDYYNDIALILT